MLVVVGFVGIFFLFFFLGLCLYITLGGIAPNQVIARSEFEVHRQMFTE